MKEYATENPSPSNNEDLMPELGESLSLLHSSLIECDLSNEMQGGTSRLTAEPCDVEPSHLSHFVVAYLPFSTIREKTEINHVLFDIYSFFDWLNKKKIHHGLKTTNISNLVKQLFAKQERCLKLNELLDSESSRVLKDPPAIQNTLNDVFLVKKIEGNFVLLKGRHQKKLLRLRLPPETIRLVELDDYLDLILGDTSEKWVLLEAGQTFPKINN